MAKKKVNPNKLPLTKADMKIAEAKWRDQLEEMKVDATSNASLFVQSVVMLALINRFSFTTDELGDLLIEMDAISNKIGDTEGEYKDYDLEAVKNELEKYNVFLKEKWK